MSASTTLTLSPTAGAEQHPQFYQSSTSGGNNNTSSSAPYYYFTSQEDEDENDILLKSDNDYNTGNMASFTYTQLPTEDTLLLERAAQTRATTGPTTITMHKSNSYSGTSGIVKTKATILKQDSANGRIATTLTDEDNDFVAGHACFPSSNSVDNLVAAEAGGEQDAFLTCSTNASPSHSSQSSRRGTRSHSKSRSAFCVRAHAFIQRNWYLSYIVPLSILLALMFVAYLTREYAKRLLFWIETQNPWIIFGIFMLLFVVVSFPIIVGYFVLMITSGYLFGCLKGFLTVILGANVGIAIAHVTIRSFRHRIPMHRIIKNETGRAILRVISGPRAFKVVLFTRLTPIPFGIQNAIFGVSSINPRVYHTATFLGLLPAQTINVYLGSTLRSMHEVLNNHGTAVTGYISFVVEVICGVALMFWVVQKARKELSETLLSDISTEGKLIDIEV